MNIEKRNEKQMFQKREAWSNGRDSQKADIVIAKWLIKDSISVLFFVIYSPSRLKGGVYSSFALLFCCIKPSVMPSSRAVSTTLLYS